MLYNSFRVAVMFASIMAIFHMFSEDNYGYILFPIIIIIWVVFSFFDEDDREYLRRNGINPDEIAWFFPEYSDYGAVRDGSNNSSHTIHSHTSTRTNSNNIKTYFNASYNGFKQKYKQSFKITLDEK